MCKITGRIYLILKVTAFPIETSAKCLLLSSSNISPIWFSLDIGLHLYLFYVGNFRIHFNVFFSSCYCVLAFVSFLSARILLVFLFCYFYYVSVSISISISILLFVILFLFCYLYLYLLFVFRYLYFVICICYFNFVSVSISISMLCKHSCLAPILSKCPHRSRSSTSSAIHPVFHPNRHFLSQPPFSGL